MRLEVRDHEREGVPRDLELLQEVAGFDAGEGRAVSLYLGMGWSDEQQRERARLFVKRATAEARRGDGEVGRDLDHVISEVELRLRRVVDERDRGVALFVCGARGLDLAVRLGR